MKNVKSSIAIQRQIPAHIRENYPLFVEFLKAYYEYLEQNQSIELEKVRDIDTSLEEFIDQFRGEISNGIPIDIAQDKRMLIKHLREFYLSRGSEASYKFIFKSLFSVNSDLYYPSTQILRASDGKWNQDVSIFVQAAESSPNLLPLSGNFITISTTRTIAGKPITKTLRTHVVRVVQYSTGIFELFIQRDYMNEIAVGSTVAFTDVNSANYSGTVLPCPAKLTVEKGGKNFKVGQLFALRTQIGRGCVVKVTKVGSQGEILKVNLITIGLDYESTFYSYLSSKELTATEYISPAQLNTPYTLGDKGYLDKTEGFEDFGYLSKQTYFNYDPNIPVGNEASAADRFFADSSYVGEISSMFYADDTSAPIDPDIAVIRVDLGPVAKYPGYYSSQDGFISDEMYIQDGEYYQAFSYVLKVEEELRKYSNLVKKILHPAGMKMFSEYTITKVVSYQSIVRALKKLINKIDEAPALDSGFNWSDYILDELTPGEYIPAPGAVKVYSSLGKAALWPRKALSDSTEATDGYTSLDLTNRFRVRSTKRFNLEVTPTDVQIASYNKVLDDSVTLTDVFVTGDIADKQLEREDFISTPDVYETVYVKVIDDTVTVTDAFRSEPLLIHDTINISSSGFITLNPYDAEEYFAAADEYNLSKLPIT